MFLARDVNYKGPLGVFTYNTQDFELMRKDTPLGKLEYLHYHGTAVDGSQITIPQGIRNCMYMFENTSIVTPPMIPVGVTNTSYMFKGCVSLEGGALLPEGVQFASFMYKNCRSLRGCYDLPDSLEKAQYMFDGCRALEVPPMIGQGLKDASGMFRGCRFMVETANVPDSLNDAHMYRNCEQLEDLLGDRYEATIADQVDFGISEMTDEVVDDIL